MPIRPVKSGEPLRIPAGDYNAMAAAADWFASTKGLRGGSSIPFGLTQVGIRNPGTSTLSKSSIVGIGSPALPLSANLSAFLAQPTFNAVAPGTAWAVAVTADAIAGGAVGLAVARPWFLARLGVGNVTHRRASPAGTLGAVAVSGDAGPLAIAWAEHRSEQGVTTGEQWALLVWEESWPETLAQITGSTAITANLRWRYSAAEVVRTSAANTVQAVTGGRTWSSGADELLNLAEVNNVAGGTWWGNQLGPSDACSGGSITLRPIQSGRVVRVWWMPDQAGVPRAWFDVPNGATISAG